MALKPQDIMVLLKLIANDGNDWTYNGLAVELGMSHSEVHGAAKRALAAQLAVKREDRLTPNIRNFVEFIVHGLRFVFFPEWGRIDARYADVVRGQSPGGEDRAHCRAITRLARPGRGGVWFFLYAAV